MPPVANDADRNILPRWRDSAILACQGELASLVPRTVPPHFAPNVFTSLVHDWKMHRTISFAADLISAAATIGQTDDELPNAIQCVDTATRAPTSLRRLAAYLKRSDISPDASSVSSVTVLRTGSVIQHRIRALKHLIRTEPRNAVALVDIARNYAVLGQDAKAKDAIRQALALAPDNRFVLRCAARMFTHMDEFEYAHDILSRSAAAKHDPWVIAAEIATANAGNRRSSGPRPM